MSADIRKLLAMNDKGVSLAEDVLARMYRSIWRDIGLNDYHWQTRVRRYLEDPTNRIPNTPNARSSHRGNLNKELASPRMSWNVFIKGLKFLGPQEVAFTLVVKWNPSRSTEHVLTMPLHTHTQPVPIHQDGLKPISTETDEALKKIFEKVMNGEDPNVEESAVLDGVELKTTKVQWNPKRTSYHQNKSAGEVAA